MGCAGFPTLLQRSSKRKHGGYYHATSVINFFVNECKVDESTFFYNWGYDPIENQSYMKKVYIDLGRYLSVEFSSGALSTREADNPNNLKPDYKGKIFKGFSDLQVYHVPQTAELAKTIVQQLTEFKLYPITESTLQMVCSGVNGFYTTSIRMKKPHIADLKLHYGDEFPKMHEELLEILQDKDSTGITFLHGPPGTGKSYYLRYLINEIKDKNLIYIPPDLVNDMTKPGFIPFLMAYPDSILIVEDAENIIQDRLASSLPNQAVANLLNVSDGLLSDALHQQIICTFNCDVKKIDSALVRDGRLVLDHKFDKLSAEKARLLCAKLGVPGEDIEQPISIAEIYTRKNGIVNDTTNDIENVDPTKKYKRPLKKRTEESDQPFGFYS
jgi:hypothetical protein